MPSAFVDANVLIRLLVDDPKPLADRAEDVLRAARERGVDVHLAPVNVAEIVFVLQSFYRWPRQQVSDRLLELFAAETLAVLERESVEQALVWYRDIAAIHFADAYVAARALREGDATVLSFDQGLRRVPGLTVVDDPSNWE